MPKGKNTVSKPEEWPVNPQPFEATLTMTFSQTGLRSINGKPPFMRCALSSSLMSSHGIHTDLPLLISINGKSIIVHAWPAPKLRDTEIHLDERVTEYLEIKSSTRLSLTPFLDFVDTDRIIVQSCPDSLCQQLPVIYSNLVILPGSVVFAQSRAYSIPPSPSSPTTAYRVTPSTLFVSTASSTTSTIPPTLSSAFSSLITAVKSHRSVALTGPSGCGKSTLISALISQLSSFSFALHSAPALLSGAFGEAERALTASRNRDIVVFDNAEVLSTDEVSRRLISALSDVCEHTALIFVSSDPESLPRELLQPSRLGVRVDIQIPNASERLAILQHLSQLSGILTDPTDLSETANAATGFVGGDLQRLISEAIIMEHSSLKHEESNTPQDNVDDKRPAWARVKKWSSTTAGAGSTEQVKRVIHLAPALGRVKPASLRHISLEVPEVHWDDIGGYEDAKQRLKESVTLPLERPEAFERLGIRPPRGVLLFGPPGCSKTLMAKAVATESKMNFVAVKGPELFSKFVGESEKAVAAVFRKARAAAPTIVFFDEIDAMATRRGAGTESGSNVTDRVLTQLLTEMDGVSTREDQAVVVIAATNRPDLLDPALMRPGRFDRLIYVPLPDKDAREKIFRVHMRKMKFSNEVHPEELMDDTQGYSGAEIAAVCREAAMNALRENPPAKEVSKNHVRSALDTVKPRTPQELVKWYEEYDKKRKY